MCQYYLTGSFLEGLAAYKTVRDDNDRLLQVIITLM